MATAGWQAVHNGVAIKPVHGPGVFQVRCAASQALTHRTPTTQTRGRRRWRTGPQSCLMLWGRAFRSVLRAGAPARLRLWPWVRSSRR